jgi:phospholipid N-methyltransferase
MDFHSHIRYREVLKAIKEDIRHNDIIDIGAGKGVLDSEVLFRRKLLPKSLTVLTYEIGS